MKTIVVKIIDPIGIHARPASKITNIASKYKSEIFFNLDGKQVNAKSLINLMSLGVRANNKIQVIVKGLDEEIAIQAIENILRETKLIA
jgi:phosphocarrier protein